MELKLEVSSASTSLLPGPNRTFMELKSRKAPQVAICRLSQSHLYGIEIAYMQQVIKRLRSQSHLYGIEIDQHSGCDKLKKSSQSHLYGIEIACLSPLPYALYMGPNRTFMELKLTRWNFANVALKSQSHLYGIEIAKFLSE